MDSLDYNEKFLNASRESHFFSCDNSVCEDLIRNKTVNHKFKNHVPKTITEDFVSPVIKFFDEMNTNVDIDAMFGVTSIDDFGKVIKNSITIKPSLSQINTKIEYVVFNNHFKKLREIVHFKFGTIDINGGTANLYYLCPEATYEPIIVMNFFNALVKDFDMIQVGSKNNSDTSMVYNCDVQGFANKLKELIDNRRGHNYDFISVESFGNKDKIKASIDDAANSLEKMLKNNFNLRHFPYLKIDYAITVSSKDRVVFPDQEFFKSVGAKPNYFLLLNYNFANCNVPLRQLRNNVMTNLDENVEKRNFYNVLEDLLSVAKKYTYIPLVSTSMMKSNLGEHSLISKGKKLTKNINDLNSMINNFKTTKMKSFDYRLEERIPFNRLTFVLTNMLHYLSRAQFLTYPTSDVLDIFHKHMTQLSANIKIEIDNPIDSLFKSIYSEHILIDLLCKGCTNLHSLLQPFHRYVKKYMTHSDKLFFQEINVNKKPKGLEADYKQTVINKTITSSLGENTAEANLLMSIMNIKTLSLPEASKLVVKQYCQDLSKRYKVTTDSNCSILRSTSHENSASERFEKAVMDSVINNTFAKITPIYWLKFPFRAMIYMFLSNNNITLEGWFKQIKTAFIEMSLDLAFNINLNLKKPSKNFIKLINPAGNAFRIEMTNTEEEISRRSEILNELNLTLVRTRNRGRVHWSDDERIRLLAARNHWHRVNGFEKILGLLHSDDLCSLFSLLEIYLKSKMHIHERTN